MFNYLCHYFVCTVLEFRYSITFFFAFSSFHLLFSNLLIVSFALSQVICDAHTHCNETNQLCYLIGFLLLLCSMLYMYIACIVNVHV